MKFGIREGWMESISEGASLSELDGGLVSTSAMVLVFFSASVGRCKEIHLLQFWSDFFVFGIQFGSLSLLLLLVAR